MQDNLYFTKEDIQKIKKKQDPRLQKLAAEVMGRAEKALALPVLTEDQVAYSGEDGKYENQHENYYDASRPFKDNMLFLGFGYDYTGDERYFEKAREMMLTYASYKKWHGKGWHGRSELNNSHFCLGMALGFDLFADKLTAEERQMIARGTYEKGILPGMEDWVLPGKKIHALDTMGHNWWIVCVSNAGLAAVVMKDEIAENEKLARIAAGAVGDWFNYPGNPINAKPVNVDNGGFYESVSYFDFAMGEYLRFRTAYRKAFGQTPFDDNAILRAAANYFVQSSYPSDEADYFLHFGDTSGKGAMLSPLLLLAEGIDLPELRWYIQSCTHRQADVLDVVNYTDVYGKEAVPPAKTSAAYGQIGWAVFRDSFEKNADMLAVKCGDTWNHAHADAGHFVFYHNGSPMIYDSGTCGYGAPQYLDYYETSQAHNVVLFNGMGQDKRDILTHARMRGAVYNFTDLAGFRYVAADATGPMGRHFRKHIRHFLWLDGLIVIYDDIESYTPGEVSFLLHGEAEDVFKMLTPCTVSTEYGYRDHDTEHPVKYLCYRQKTDQDCRAKFISVIMPGRQDTPALSKIENGYQLTYGEIKVYFNLLSDGRIMHRNCTNTLGGYTTDGVILAECKGRIGVVNASIVRREGEVILDTLRRVNGWTDLWNCQ